MKKKLIIIILATFSHIILAQVGINTQTPHTSSLLDLNSDTKGLLLPRISTAAANNLSNTASEGLVVFDKDKKAFIGWDGTKWQNLGYEEINTVPSATNVTISGNYTIGSVLTGNYTFSDAESNPDNASALIWKRADDALGTNIAAIASATAQNYITGAADLNKFIQFCVTPGSLAGASPGLQKCSAWGGPVGANQAPVATGVTISGNAIQGQTLTGSYTYNDAEGNTQGTSTFRWTRSDNASGANETTISGANGITYTVGSGDVGKYIKFYVTPIATSGTITGAETGSAFKGPVVNLITGTIFSQGFETGDVVNYTTSGFFPGGLNFTSGTTAASGDAPTSSPLFSTGSRGYGYSNPTAGTVTSTYVEFNTVDASSYTNNITFSFDVAAFSIGSSTNGMESSDLVSLEISTDGGATYATKLTLLGGNSSSGSNVRWAFSGTGTATNSYSSANLNVTSPNTSNPSGITVTGSQAITKLSVTGIPNSSQLRIRIGLRNNVSSELWVIDNVQLTAL